MAGVRRPEEFMAWQLATRLKQENEALEGYKAMLPLVEGDVALTSMISRLVAYEIEG